MLKKDDDINMVNVLIRNKDNRALLIHNIKHNADRWEFTGGKLEKGLSLEEMAVKEPFQELGIKVNFQLQNNFEHAQGPKFLTYWKLL